MSNLNIKSEDLRSVCYVASFYITLLFPINTANLHAGLQPQEFLYHLMTRSNLPVDFVWIAICLLEKLQGCISNKVRIGSVYKLIVAAMILAHKSHSDIVVSVL